MYHSSKAFTRLFLLFAVCLFVQPAKAKYDGGTGEPNDPYLIYTPEQMNTIGAEPNDWNNHFKLMADIDLSAYAGSAFNMIGNYTMPFTGVFDGNNHTISNFKIARNSDSAGLFGYVSGEFAKLMNTMLIDPNISGVRHCGSLVGKMNSGTVIHCSTINGIVSGEFGQVGGLIGFVEYAIIRECCSSARVTGQSSVGGLVGLCRYDTLITNCAASGEVRGTRDYVGGLVGNCQKNSVIAGSFAVGDVASSNSGSNDCVGGLVGSLNNSRIICCYAMGNVSGGGDIGGFVGRSIYGYFIDSYAVGEVYGTGGNVGGFDGDPSFTSQFYDCFWDVETSKIMTISPAGTGLTTTKMKDPNIFINAGWDFIGETVNGPSDIWFMPESGGYPILSWQISPLPPLPTFSGGTGEPNDPFIISTAEEINSIGHNPRLM